MFLEWMDESLYQLLPPFTQITYYILPLFLFLFVCLIFPGLQAFDSQDWSREDVPFLSCCPRLGVRGGTCTQKALSGSG